MDGWTDGLMDVLPFWLSYSTNTHILYSDLEPLGIIRITLFIFVLKSVAVM